MHAGLNPAAKLGLVYVRGGEVVEVRDAKDRLMNDFTGRVQPDQRFPPDGLKRTLVLSMDAAQYSLDVARAEAGSEDVYATFNILMRRKSKENNFKAVLDSIRDLMNEDCVMPDWLHDVFLGYGDPAAAQPESMPADKLAGTLDFKDTFLDKQHVEEVFGGEYKVEFHSSQPDGALRPPFRVAFPADKPVPGAKDNEELAVSTRGAEGAASASRPVLRVESYQPVDPGPYPQDQSGQNTVRFTPVQVQAIASGLQPGLTMVVGPPGTGEPPRPLTPSAPLAPGTGPYPDPAAVLAPPYLQARPTRRRRSSICSITTSLGSGPSW